MLDLKVRVRMVETKGTSGFKLVGREVAKPQAHTGMLPRHVGNCKAIAMHRQHRGVAVLWTVQITAGPSRRGPGKPT